MWTKQDIYNFEEENHTRSIPLRRTFNLLKGGAREKVRQRKMAQIQTMKEEGRMALTFGEVSTTHIGGQEQGAMHKTGFSVTQLKQLQTLFDETAVEYNKTNGHRPRVHTEFYDLTTDELPETKRKEHEAGVLVLRNGANLFLNNGYQPRMHAFGDMAENEKAIPGADKLLYEQYEKVEWDRTSYNMKQDCYTNKRSRYNTVYTAGDREVQNVFGWFIPNAKMSKRDREEKKKTLTTPPESYGSHTIRGNVKTDAKRVVGKTMDAAFASKAQFILDRQHPNYVEATRNPFSELPLLSKVRDRFSEFTNLIDPDERKGNDLNAEGNWYRKDTKSQIGWHGDSERRIVICLCLGKSSPLFYAWRAPKSSDNLAIKTLHVHHGDVYFMSAKATGSDWVGKTPDYPNGRSGWRLVHAAGNVEKAKAKKRKAKTAAGASSSKKK